MRKKSNLNDENETPTLPHTFTLMVDSYVDWHPCTVPAMVEDFLGVYPKSSP